MLLYVKRKKKDEIVFYLTASFTSQRNESRSPLADLRRSDETTVDRLFCYSRIKVSLARSRRSASYRMYPSIRGFRRESIDDICKAVILYILNASRISVE